MGFGKDGRGQILWEDIVVISLGTLAALDLVLQSSTIGAALLEDFRILKTQYFMFFDPGSSDGSEGPIVVGWAGPSLNAAEVEEAIESKPNDLNDVPESEQTLRAVFPLEIFNSLGDGTTPINSSHHMTKGEFNPRWTIPTPKGWSWYAYNMGGVALSGTGEVRIQAKHFGVWVI